MKKEIAINRREKLKEKLENNSMVILFAGRDVKKSADEMYPFSVNKNFYYLTLIDEKEVSYIGLKDKNGEFKEYLYIKERDELEEKWVGKTISREEAIEKSGIKDIRFLADINNDINDLIMNGITNVYFDLERDNYEDLQSYSENFAFKLKNKYSYVCIKNIYNYICEQRMIKDKYEIENIKKAIEITKDGIEYMMLNSKAGIKEYQLEAYFNFILNTNGVKEVAFDTIAASGKNATVLHYSSNNDILKENDLILFDLGAKYNEYCADISRTFPVNGKFTERQKQIYNIVLKAEEETIKSARGGMTFKELNEVTKKVLAEELKKACIIKEDSELAKYYYHGVSHSLGIDVHDVGEHNEIKEGMVITIEPGLYISEENIGIRIEDDILITKDGAEILSPQIIKTVEDIEKFMGKR